MINIFNFTNAELLSEVKGKVQGERSLTAEILHLLREVERRRLHLEKGFESLFEFCTQELLYSEAAASRRISAMRLLTQLPEIEEKVHSGSLSLSNAAQAQRFFINAAKTGHGQKTLKYTREEKLEIVLSLQEKSTREAEKELLKINPRALPKEKTR